MTVEMCDPAGVAKYEPSDELRTAKEAFDEAEAVRDAKLEQLYDAAADELRKRPDVATTALATYLNRSDGHVRREVRKRGLKPRVDVEPPRRLKSTPEPGHDPSPPA